MKVCFPIQENEGMNSVPHMHFGNAKMFMPQNLIQKCIEQIKIHPLLK